MRAFPRLLLLPPLACALALAGCAVKETKAPPTPPPPVVPTVMPTPPNSAAPDMDLPDQAADGSYITPNRGMRGEQALWHVRMALNVAALSCLQGGDRVRVQYNQMLRIHAAPLARANNAIEAIYFGRNQANFVAAREQLNTTVYNFFALPPVQKAFCAKSLDIITIINGMTSDALLGYAPTALEELEKPFQEFYAAYADYLRRLAEWRKRFGAQVMVLGPEDEEPPAPPAAPAGGPPPPLPFSLPSTPTGQP